MFSIIIIIVLNQKRAKFYHNCYYLLEFSKKGNIFIKLNYLNNKNLYNYKLKRFSMYSIAALSVINNVY